MRDYMIQWHGVTGSLTWQYEFSVHNDEIAVEYTESHVKRMGIQPGVMSFLLWVDLNSTSDSVNPHWKLLAEFKQEVIVLRLPVVPETPKNP